MKIQPQSGLGDLLFTFPLIESLLIKGEQVTIAANHSYALNHYHSEFGHQIQTVPVEFTGPVPKLKEGFTKLKYSRYKAHYFESYYADQKLSIHEAIYKAKSRIANNAENKAWRFTSSPYCVYAMPRAANRHKAARNFSCAPDVDYAGRRVLMSGLPIVTVGQNEVFCEGQRQFGDFNLVDRLSFYELVSVVMNAQRVVSQISAITALAGLLGVETDFLPSRNETPALHAAHVAGVVWPGQKVV